MSAVLTRDPYNCATEAFVSQISFSPMPANPGCRAHTLSIPLVALMLITCDLPAYAFGLQDVDAKARKMADKSFADDSVRIPSALRDLTQEQYHAITYKPGASYWQKEKLPFELQFFHQGWRFDRPVKINEISAKGVQEIKFDPQSFDYGKSGIDPKTTNGLGFAGFHVNYPLNSPARKDEALSFLGASYFRALGKDQTYGISARGVAIDTALSSGEEFPRFIEFWIERPQAQAKQLIIYGLLDSPRMTGAYRFVLVPGGDTALEITAHLYARDAIEKLGLAPLTSMFFFGSNQRGASDDFRPEVHDSDGLSLLSADGKWTWRPLINPKRLLVTSFGMTDPRGFGLLQRSREFVNYEDINARYETHPDAWVEPIGNWGKGRVELVEIPSPDETNDNIVAYWLSETAVQPKKPVNLHYRLHWTKQDPKTQPPTAWVARTLRGKVGFPKPEDGIGFVVDFEGPMFAALAADSKLDTNLSIDPNAVLIASDSRWNPSTGGWRVTLRMKRNDANKPVEMRVSLRSNDKESETWSYILPPE